MPARKRRRTHTRARARGRGREDGVEVSSCHNTRACIRGVSRFNRGTCTKNAAKVSVRRSVRAGAGSRDEANSGIQSEPNRFVVKRRIASEIKARPAGEK